MREILVKPSSLFGTFLRNPVPRFPTFFGLCFLGSKKFRAKKLFGSKRQSPKNMGNLGTGFLRKVSKSEEGLRRLSRINVAKQMEKVKRLRNFLTI